MSNSLIAVFGQRGFAGISVRFKPDFGSPEHARVTTAAVRMLPVGARDAHFQGFRLRIGGRREAGRGGYGRNPWVIWWIIDENGGDGRPV